MAARQIGRTFWCVLARGADRCIAGDLPLYRQRPRRGRTGQATDRRRDPWTYSPPLRDSGTPERLSRLEALLDEFSNADGLDPRRRDRLQGDIRAEAQTQGVERDLGLDGAACSAEAITRIDRFVCDIKESQFGEGLHIWGRAPVGKTPFATAESANGERQSLLDALDGRRIEAGPSGSPYRGRSDVLPTGRNLYTTDPRAVPTRAAYAQGVRLAEELIRRHLQDEGDWPRGLIVDLWGSATMRTAGEDFAMALHLLGVRPVWDAGSERVSGSRSCLWLK